MHTVQNPSPGGGLSLAVPFNVIRVLNYYANALVFDPFRNRFYAAIASASSQRPNAIITIDAVTGAVSSPIACGNDPNNLTITGDGKYLYFSTLNNAAANAQKIDISSGTLTTVFSNTGLFQNYGSITAMATVPGRPDSVIFIHGGFGAGLLAVYDGGVQRPGIVSLGVLSQNQPINIGVAQARTFYAQGQRFQLEGAGITPTAIVPDSQAAVNYDDGHLFFYGGGITSESSLAREAQLFPTGTYPYLYEGLGDASAQRAYYRGYGGIWDSIHIFDSTTFQETSQIITGNPKQILHWDSDQLAVINGSAYGMSPNISFVRSPAVAGVTGNPRPSISSVTPDSTTLNSPDVAITVTGVNFVSSSQIRFNGSPVQTNYVSPTQLTAMIPSAMLSVAGASYLTVLNPPPAGGESNALIMKVVPPAMSITSLNPASQGKGHPDFLLTVSGHNFTPDSVVSWNGSPRVTHFNSESEVTVLVKASDVSAAGVATVAVSDWIAGVSGSANFTINAAPQATFSPTYLGFGVKKVGVTSTALTAVLTNTGDDVLRVQSISAPSPFAATSDCGPTLAAGASCTVRVTTTPGAVTPYSATLILDSNSVAAPAPVTLFAYGGLANLQLNTSSLSFPPQLVLSPSTTRFIALSNQGNLPMTIGNISTTGDFEFVSTTCPTPVNQFMGCGINVLFRPKHPTDTQLTGTLVINSDAPGSPHTIQLSGFTYDMMLTTPRPTRPSRNTGNQAAQKQTLELQLSGHTSEPVHLSCDQINVKCEFSEQDFVLDGSKQVKVGLSAARANRVGTSHYVLRSLRLGDIAAPTANVEVIATSGAIRRSLVLTLPAQ